MFWQVTYEISVMLLVITYAIVIFADPVSHPKLTEEMVQQIDMALIIFLVIEYAFRLWRAKAKKKFVLQNWFDLVAMIPLDHYFYLARFMRLIRLIRIVRASPFLWVVVKSKPLKRIFAIASVIMLWSSIGIYLLESGVNKNINSLGDAFWWSIVTTSTVGYGDISPVTVGGRVIAAFLMFTGIGVLGALTANLANHWADYFEHQEESAQNRVRVEIKRSVLRAVQNIEKLSEEEYRTLLETIDTLHRDRWIEPGEKVHTRGTQDK